MPAWQAAAPGTNNSSVVSSADTFESGDLGQKSYSFCQSEAVGGSPGTPCREVPDVSANANELTGVTVYSSSFTGPGTFSGWTTFGGTSSAAPIWAAAMALMNASSPCSTDTVGGFRDAGFASPLLYQAAVSNYSTSFNGVGASNLFGPNNNDPYALSNLYPVTSNYNMATGLGSPQLVQPGGGAGLAAAVCAAPKAAGAPAVSGVSPAFGSTTASTTVTISGSGFQPSGVQVAGIEVGGLELSPKTQSATSITVTLPPTAKYVTPPADSTDGAGAYQIIVTLTNGQSTAPGPNSVFEYVDETAGHSTLPAVTGVVTYGGPDSGGNTVDIFGTGFTGATSVTFGAVAATTYTVKSDWHIQATVPALGFGTKCAQHGAFLGDTATNDVCQVAVSVTNANGSSGVPTIHPLFEGDPTSALPPGQESAPQPAEYDYFAPPSVTSVFTAGGGANTVVTLLGAGFNMAGLDWIDVGDAGQATSQLPFFDITLETGTEIQFTSPPTPAAPFSLSVKTLGGQATAGSPDATTISTASGSANGGTRVTIGGANLGCVQAVYFGSTRATAVSNAPASPATLCGSTSFVYATVPALPGGTAFPRTVNVTVQTAESVYTHSSGRAVSFTYQPAADAGYRMYTSAGIVYSFGADRSYGSLAGVHLNRPIVGATPTADGKGYWLVAGDGGIFAFGDAHFYGSTGGIRLNKPIVGMAATRDGKGYWLVATDGGIFAFGDARFYGSTGGITLNKPVVGMARTTDGKGYWMVATDGGIFSFGDARFYGSTGNITLAQPIHGMVPTSDGRGYWMVASDGGIFTFGDARFFGSAGNRAVGSPAVKILASPDGRGYGLVFANGSLLPYGDFHSFGSVADAGPVVDASL
jgi:hypothetical protein